MNVKWKLIGMVDKTVFLSRAGTLYGIEIHNACTTIEVKRSSNDQTERCGASSTCIDTDGSYECGCEEGYEYTGPEKDEETGNIKLGARDSNNSPTGVKLE